MRIFKKICGYLILLIGFFFILSMLMNLKQMPPLVFNDSDPNALIIGHILGLIIVLTGLFFLLRFGLRLVRSK